MDVAQVEEVAVVVGVGGGGEGLPDAVFGVVKQRGEGGEQAAALPLGAGAVQGGAQVGKGVFVCRCFVFALFDGGEVVEVGLGFVVVGAGEEAVMVGAVFGVADGGEQVGKGAGDAAGKEVLFVLEFAVDAVPVQFLLQGDEAVVAAHEDLDVARVDAAQAAVVVAPRVGRGCSEELCGEGGDFVGFFVLVLAAVHPDEGGGDGVAVVVNDAVFQVGGAGGVVVDVVAEAVVVVMGVVFVVRGDEVGGTAVVGEELMAVSRGDVLFEAVVVGDVATAKAVDGLFGVANEEEEAARRRGVVAQVGVFEQARLVVVEVLGFVHQHDGVAVGEVAGECGTVRAFQGAVQAGDFVVEGGFATLFAGGGQFGADGGDEGGGRSGVEGVVVVLVGEGGAQQGGEWVVVVAGGESVVAFVEFGVEDAGCEGGAGVVQRAVVAQLGDKRGQGGAVFFPGGVFAGGGKECVAVNECLPVGDEGGVKVAQGGAGSGAVGCVRRGDGGDGGFVVAGRGGDGAQVDVAVVQAAACDEAGVFGGVGLGEFVADAAQVVVDGVEVGAAVFVDLQVFVAAGFQRVFDEPALADAVEGADGEFVQGDAGIFDAAVEVDEAVQSAFAHGGEDEVAVDGVGFARAVKLCAEAGCEGVVVIQQGLIRQVGVGNGFEALAQGVQAVAHAVLHFGGGFAGEGGGDDVARGGSGFEQQAQDDAGERPGFAGAGRGFDEGAATQGQGEGGGVHGGVLVGGYVMGLPYTECAGLSRRSTKRRKH